jgi:hypothetical protein
MFALCMPCLTDASTCYGSVGNRRLYDGVQLPARDDNFVADSVLGIELGGTHVHGLMCQALLEVRKRSKNHTGQLYVHSETGPLAERQYIPPHE